MRPFRLMAATQAGGEGDSREGEPGQRARGTAARRETGQRRADGRPRRAERKSPGSR